MTHQGLRSHGAPRIFPEAELVELELSSTLILVLSSPASLLKFMGETSHFLKVLRTVEGSGRSRGFTQVQIHSVFKLHL